MTKPAPNDQRKDVPRHDPIAYRVSEAIDVSGLSRTTIYELIAAGKLKSKLVGRRRLIDAASLREIAVGEGA